MLGRFAPRRLGTAWLVLASLFFYGYWDVRYVPLLLASILFNYFVSTRILVRRSRAWLAFGIVVNFLLLGYFKYTDFFLASLNDLAGAEIFALPQIVLPLGISFFTFTQTAYLVDVYRGELEETSLLTYLEFVTIFPHLIAGPIISYREMVPQFLAARAFRLDADNVARGLTIFTLGLAKKVLIADQLSPLVGELFARAQDLTCIEAWVAALGYTLQLYFDFSGYSEMAIGLGLLFNLRFPVNFNSPYQATSVIDFWRRWHMTLGLWVKDYLYIPLGGNRHGQVKKMRNLFVSMLIIGLWHGAGWTFVFWGALHGAGLRVNHIWRSLGHSLPKEAGRLLTFLFVVVCWVFFRAESFPDAFAVLRSMTDVWNLGLPDVGFLSDFGVVSSPWVLHRSLRQCLTFLLPLLVMVRFLPNPLYLLEQEARFRRHVLLPVSLGLLFCVTLLVMNFGASEFLYFQF